MRRRAREVALHLLFESLYRRDEYDAGIDAQIERYFVVQPGLDAETRRFMGHLVRGVLVDEQALDRRIETAGSNWRLDRMGRIERTILRIGIFELTTPDQNGALTPPEIVIDEAVELAKMYGSDESPRFVNGILDAVARTVLSGSSAVSDKRGS